MFWSDPNLYGASFMYRDINAPVQAPFLGPVIPWQNLQRFLPANYGLVPPYFNWNVPPMALTPQIQPPMMNPYIQPTAWNPFMQPTAVNPFMQPFNVNLPLQHLHRPFAC